MPTTLNDLMSFGHVVYSDGAGNVTDSSIPTGLPYAGESLADYLSADGDSSDDLEALPQGWELLTGFTGQSGYRGPVMHESEFVGGGLERHIRETAGYFVCLIVTGMHTDDCACSAPDGCRYSGEDAPESDDYGWCVAYHAPLTTDTD